MNFGMTKACNDCPFRKVGGIPLRTSRIEELSDNILNSNGGVFPCHKSVKSADDSLEVDEFRDTSEEVHCAGAMAYALKQNTATQIMRIAMRFGDLDCDVVERDSGPLVWDSLDDWLGSSHAVQE